ncbi:hypothetical protein DEO72_LG2g2356 [Vigna unguiculata]|uniref:Uncharacterized protein n=1 Tax=Vigna unguiculata TaxID=3917 RepID=A0A4D6KYU8_VIGUN|nr:hypothetical protein DEO72_LG2g2356 [Vigna unguiculata]
MVFLQELVPEFTALGISNMGFVRFDETFFDYWGQHMEMGTNYFRDSIRIFNLAMKEIDYPAPKLVPNPQRPLSSLRLFSSEGIEINYAPQVVSVSNHDTHLGDYDSADFYYSMANCLSENDTKSSSLYLESEFAAKALVKKRTRYILVNAEGDCWPCTIQRSGRRNK